MDKTYSETQGKAPFDWWKALNAALVNEPTPEEKENLSARALSWITCACGNQCAIIPRAANSIPIDWKLDDLGCEFGVAVCANDWSAAITTLHKIEACSTILIKETLESLAAHAHDGSPCGTEEGK